MNTEVERVAKKIHGEILRITDAHSVEDLRMALRGTGMFDATRVLVLEGILGNEEMYPVLMNMLPTLGGSKEEIFMYEEKPPADIRRKVEKYAEKSMRHDAAGKEKDTSIFTLSAALARGDRKALWVGYQRALARGDAIEAIHGVLFWGAKKILLSAPKESSMFDRGAALVAELAELPHKARRQSIELEYSLERYLLNVNKV